MNIVHATLASLSALIVSISIGCAPATPAPATPRYPPAPMPQRLSPDPHAERRSAIIRQEGPALAYTWVMQWRAREDYSDSSIAVYQAERRRIMEERTEAIRNLRTPEEQALVREQLRETEKRFKRTIMASPPPKPEPWYIGPSLLVPIDTLGLDASQIVQVVALVREYRAIFSDIQKEVEHTRRSPEALARYNAEFRAYETKLRDILTAEQRAAVKAMVPKLQHTADSIRTLWNLNRHDTTK